MMQKTKRFRRAALICVFLMAFLFSTAVTASPNSQENTPPPPQPPIRTPSGEIDRSNIPEPSAITPATAQQLAEAMNVQAFDILAADLMGSDTTGVGVSDAPLGAWFPTQGSSFALLATGRAADALLPDSQGNLSTILGGLDNNQGNDLVRLHLQLRVPSYANCANFDFAFYSEEFPEFVGSMFNDTFTAQLNNSSLTVQGQTVLAPGNFAFDTQNNIISVNTVFGVSGPTGTTYDGVTPLLRATTAVTPGAVVDFYFSIQDLGDSIYDSAVFMDKFFWSSDPVCNPGASVDTDGDGLLDDWETRGITVTVGSSPVFVDLPAMGANPEHKDVFVEVDWMVDTSHSHRPDDTAIQRVVDAFNAAPVTNPDGNPGIHLHVDYGPTSPLTWGAGATWGSLSDGDILTHAANLGTSDAAGNYNWAAFDVIKAANFSPARAAIFHYNVWVHNLALAFGSTSGISRNPDGVAFGSGASDFIVSLGGWDGQTGTANQQSGTFMHELGHNLGLRHGGEDHTQWKPNYLSVMNYLFQTRGLIINNAQGNFDYSRYDLADLTESNLNETVGINIPGSVTDILGTRYYCSLGDQRVDMDARAVDWNCDGDSSDATVSRNINRGENWNNNTTLDTLTSQNDWDNLVFTGGAIGAPGAIIDLPMSTEVIDIDKNQDATLPDGPTTDEVDLLVTSVALVSTQPSSEVSVPINFVNYGLTTASSVVLTATLDSLLVYISDTSGISPTVTGDNIVWNLPDLNLTEPGHFLLMVGVPASGLGPVYPITWAIASDGPEFDPANNTATIDVFVSDSVYIPVISGH